MASLKRRSMGWAISLGDEVDAGAGRCEGNGFRSGTRQRRTCSKVTPSIHFLGRGPVPHPPHALVSACHFGSFHGVPYPEADSQQRAEIQRGS